MRGPRIELRRITIVLPHGTKGLEELDLVVEEAELLALLGPSGSGKSLLLRLVAGLETPSSGTILIGGSPVEGVPASARDVAMVSQDSHLYPFLDVRRNLGFGLRSRRLPDDEVERRVETEARVLGLSRLLDRLPGRLSAGERQAAAAGRALVRPARVMLLDDPLSRLDPPRRRRLLKEIATLHSGYGSTTVYATGDPAEAMSLGERVAVLDRGSVRQVGPGNEVFLRPSHLDVARLLGPINVLEGTIVRREDGLFLSSPEGLIRLRRPALVTEVGRRVRLGVRPQHLRRGAGGLQMTVDRVDHLGAERLLTGRTPGGEKVAARVGGEAVTAGSSVELEVEGRHIQLFDADTGLLVAPALG